LISRRALKTIAIVYAVKTVLVGAAWLAIPDLPQRAMIQARQAWAWAGGAPAAPAAARVAAP
jgi:hypothetical protein